MENCTICDECGKTFANETYVKKHKKEVHTEISQEHQQCPKCPMTFKNCRRFWQHILSTHELTTNADDGDDEVEECQTTNRKQEDSLVESYFSLTVNLGCNECGKVFCDKSGLRRHINKVHLKRSRLPIDKPAYDCVKCDRRFQTKEEFDQHFSKFHRDFESDEERIFPCALCDIEFNSGDKLTLHKRNIHRITSLPIPKSEESNSKVTTLADSVIADINDKKGPVSCPTCGKVLCDRQTLRKHLRRVHSVGVSRQFTCVHCGKSFREKRALRKHLIVHQSASIENHAKNMLKSLFGMVCSQSFTCGICKTVVISSFEARVHVYIKHPEKFLELIIEKAENEGRNGLTCPVCSEAFTTKQQLLEHWESEHPSEKIPKCAICGLKDLTERDLNFHYKDAHPNQSRYVCTVCKMSFTQKRVLDAHMKREHEGDVGQCPYCLEKHDRVKTHVTRKHPERAEEYNKMVQEHIRQEQVERMKFNQFLSSDTVGEETKTIDLPETYKIEKAVTQPHVIEVHRLPPPQQEEIPDNYLSQYCPPVELPENTLGEPIDVKPSVDELAVCEYSAFTLTVQFPLK